MKGASPPAGDPRGGSPDQRFPRSARLRRGSEIRALRSRGKRRKTPHLDVFFDASPVSRARYGVVVPKHRHTGVERNRVKRRLKEIGRTEVLPRLRAHGVAADVLVRARREAYEATYAELRAEVVRVVEEDMCANS